MTNCAMNDRKWFISICNCVSDSKIYKTQTELYNTQCTLQLLSYSNYTRGEIRQRFGAKNQREGLTIMPCNR